MRAFRKTFMSIISLLLALTFVFTFVACGGDDNGGGGGKSEILWIGNYDGASGHRWLDKWIEDYKKIPGNENVKIFVENKKEEFSLSKLCADMQYSDNDIYFLDHIYYKDLISNDLVEDITDIVTEKIYNDEGDFPAEGQTATKSIADMMYPEMRDFYNTGTADAPQFYCTPFSFMISGITYDADLFNQERWFFDKNGEIGVKKDDPNVGPGPDGLYETTYDNGEPETWADFNKLLKQIVDDEYTPFTWSGQYCYQRQYFQKAVMSQYEGLDNFLLYYTLNGTDSNLGEITTETGYKLLDQKGVLAQCIAAADIMSDSRNYSNNAFNTLTQSHTTAEAEFAYSIESNAKQIAMFLESSYWEQEAAPTFAEMEELNPNYAYGKRNFAFMSIPRFKGDSRIPDSTNDMTTLWGDATGKPCFINKYSKQKERARDFFKFVHSRTANATFTANSNTIRPYYYDLTEAEYKTATPYMRTVIDRFVDKEHVNVVIGQEYNAATKNSSSYNIYWNVGCEIRNSNNELKTYIDLFSAYKDFPSLTYTDMLQKVKDHTTKEIWEGYFAK